jgi:hypothetical protein
MPSNPPQQEPRYVDLVRSLERQLAEAEAQLHAQDEAIADLKSENVALRENNINVKELFDGKCLGIAQAWAEIREKDEAIATLRAALDEVLSRFAPSDILRQITPDEAAHVRTLHSDSVTVADVYRWRSIGQPDTSPKARRP